ncbi:MAG: tetratricopeptide repeat protein [Bacteroidota bacterium]|nr:tetratricopeptide repeat protein [Bacteroidota bacterium]
MMTLAEIDELTFDAWEKRRIALRESFDLAMRAKEAAEGLDYTKGIADSSKVLGYCYWRFSDYSLSLTHSLKALKIYIELNAQKDEADTLNSIGAVYMFQKDHAKRLECNLRCLKIRENVGDEEGVSGSQNNIGETYFEMGDPDNALIWFYASLNNPSVSPQIKAWATHNIGKVYVSQKAVEKGIEYFINSLEVSEHANYDVLSSVTCLELSAVYFGIKNFKQSEHFATKALGIAEKTGSKEEVKNALFLIAQIKESVGNLEDALFFYKKHHATHIEIFNEVNVQRIRDIEFQYEIERITKEAEIERLKTVELRAANLEIENQKRLLEHRNVEIIDSIKYARRIQQALLKDEEHVSKHLPAHFILYKPKDIVSGDFYWVLEKGPHLYVAVADCTGHGVPGAFLTMLGTSYINEITSRDDLPSPAQILDELRVKFVKELGADGETKDGMDISMIRINYKTRGVVWAGANNPLWIIRKGAAEVEEIKANKQAIGLMRAPSMFTDHELKLAVGDTVYLFTDGYPDQFGGERGKKFKYKQLKDVLLANNHLSPQQQKQSLDKVFSDWRGDLEQVDDVCIIGMRL